MTYQMWQDSHRRIAVEVDENPRYKRWLMVTSGGVDIEKMTAVDIAVDGWQRIELERGALRYALCFARSTLLKSARAWSTMKEIIAMELRDMSMAELVTEYHRLTGKTVKKFESKAAAIKIIEKAATPRNIEPAPALNGAIAKTVKQLMENTEMTTKAKATKAKATKAKATKAKATKAKANGKPDAAKLERAKKIANTTRGAGGVIVALLKAGKLDDDAILSKAIKEFPDQNTKLSHVHWYRSMLKTAGAL